MHGLENCRITQIAYLGLSCDSAIKWRRGWRECWLAGIPAGIQAGWSIQASGIPKRARLPDWAFPLSASRDSSAIWPFSNLAI